MDRPVESPVGVVGARLAVVDEVGLAERRDRWTGGTKGTVRLVDVGVNRAV